MSTELPSSKLLVAVIKLIGSVKRVIAQAWIGMTIHLWFRSYTVFAVAVMLFGYL